MAEFLGISHLVSEYILEANFSCPAWFFSLWMIGVKAIILPSNAVKLKAKEISNLGSKLFANSVSHTALAAKIALPPKILLSPSSDSP